MTAIHSVSVIIPHYGDPALADALVGQLTSQARASEFEIIVVDDASPQAYPDDDRVRLVRRERNGGFGAAVNSGAAEASHPYLLVLNSDLTVNDTFLADLCVVAAPFQPAVVGPMVVGHDGTSQWAGRKFPRTSHYFVEWLTILARFKDTRWRHAAIGHDVRCVAGTTQPVDWLMGAAMLIPTDAFRLVGGFDESFHMNCEEVDLQRRLRARGVPSVFAGTVTVTHAGGASSGDQQQRIRRIVESRLRYAEKWHVRRARIRATLIAASIVNAVTNIGRRLGGRVVQPYAILASELRMLRRGATGSARSGNEQPDAIGPTTLRVGFLTPWGIDDPNAWSGVIGPMYRALDESVELVPLSTHDVSTALIDRALARLIGTVSHKKYLWEFGISNAVKRGRVASRRIRDANVDVVLAVAASVDVAFARTRGTPIVQVSDATFKSMEDLYPMFTGLSAISKLQARIVTEVSTARTDAFLTASQWVAKSLAADYGVPRSSITMAPLGPAIEPAEPSQRTGPHNPLRVLVVATDWERKRGAACVEAVRGARSRGADVVLTVVGDMRTGMPCWVTNLGRLSRTELSAVYAASDVLLDLSVATAASVVATDAVAHGLPVIARDTAGTSSIVVDGRTGFLLEPANDSDSAADLLSRWGVLYRSLRSHSPMEDPAVGRSKWTIWTEEALNVIIPLCSANAISTNKTYPWQQF